MATVALMPAVEWRWAESGLPLVRALAPQVDALYLLGHGFDPSRDVADLATVRVRAHGEVLPPGRRWGWLGELEDGDIVVSIDDDFALGDCYVERTVAARARLGGAVTWYGLRPGGERCMYWTDTPDTDLPMLSLGTGCCALEVAQLRGMERDLDAARVLFAADGDEEAFVSWWLWQRGVPIWRPSGPAPMRSNACQHDERASYRVHPTRASVWGSYLRDVRGWPWRVSTLGPQGHVGPPT